MRREKEEVRRDRRELASVRGEMCQGRGGGGEELGLRGRPDH